MGQKLQIKIDNEHSLIQAFKTGVNVFVGAGFSILAKDKYNQNLPLASNLLIELQRKFNKPLKLSLPQLSTILESTQKTEFYQYLVDRFTVCYVNPLYYNLNKINVKSVYTTNIDDLIPRIVKQRTNRYINDQIANGPSPDPLCINYLPLHGNVAIVPHKFIFDIASLANIFNDVPRIWNCLSREMEMYPTIFLGYGFGDSSVIQALTSQRTFNNAQKDKWVLLRNEDKDYAELYSSLGFHIIYADIESFLNYVGNDYGNEKKEVFDEKLMSLLTANIVPHSIYDLTIQRPIAEFYRGSNPRWCDILSNQVYKTHHVYTVQNSIYTPGKNTVIIGAPVSGKTTLLMQVANDTHDLGLKLYFDYLSEGKAEYIVKLIGDKHAVIFIDNLYESIDALPILDRVNIKIVGAERSHNYGIISHLLSEEKYSVINITTLSDQDTQGIYNSLPPSIRCDVLQRESELDLYGKDSIFEFVIRNITLQNIKERYKTALQALERDDPDLAEFLVLCGYMHSCRIPLSSEMAHSYFDGYDYDDIFLMKSDAGDIIKDYIPHDSNFADMDYYYPRSVYIAEVIIDTCSKTILKNVMMNVLKCVPSFIICNYKTFRKYAFDKVIVSRAFENWEEGQEFYEKAFLYDSHNPYVLQQGALYLAQKKQYEQAFIWIDRALSMTDDKYFSIRNSHAIILFNANINKNGDGVRAELDRSMRILERCMKADSRKRFHANTYGNQSIRYYERFQDEQSLEYLNQALEWLNREADNSAWDLDTRKIRDKVNDILKN